MELNDILNIEDLKERRVELEKYYSVALMRQHCDTGRKSIITEKEFKEYVEIFVEYDLAFKCFPENHPKFPGMPMARTIRNYFDYDAKVHGYETYDEFVRWKYSEGPWKPREILSFIDFKYE